MDTMMAQPLQRGSTDGAWIAWPGNLNSSTPNFLHTHGPSLEDFPPLERGNAMKIRDTFENGPKLPKSIGGWAGKQASVKVVVDKAAQVGMQNDPPVSNSGISPRTQADPRGTSLQPLGVAENSDVSGGVGASSSSGTSGVSANPDVSAIVGSSGVTDAPGASEMVGVSGVSDTLGMSGKLGTSDVSGVLDKVGAPGAVVLEGVIGGSDVSGKSRTSGATFMDDVSAVTDVSGAPCALEGPGSTDQNKAGYLHVKPQGNPGQPRRVSAAETVVLPNKTMMGPNQAGGGVTNPKLNQSTKTMADLLRGTSNSDGPQVFVPENIPNIGFASTSNGIPSIYFSGAEIQKLATNLGHAIVGKFSHSIPSSFQIQKALDNIKFCRGFSWNYINAKHILVQFEDIGDYARLLSGPKGTPVWFIDRHPMRVFKWTPDFDSYCESPIAAIWCNLIGLPIHLFDQAALFAIGKLLGTPIQVDRATANKSRLSFARLCIEINITKPPPEEIILDICGKELVQQVKWDKIPSYCHECKHVGHKSDVCYAAGKGVRPLRRNYNVGTSKQQQQGQQGSKGKQEQLNQYGSKNDGKHQENSNGEKNIVAVEPAVTNEDDHEWRGPDIMGDFQGIHGQDSGHTSKAAMGSDGTDHPRPWSPPVSHGMTDDRFHFNPKRNFGENRGDFSGRRGRSRGSGRHQATRGRDAKTDRNILTSNQYYSLMSSEGFVGEDFESAEHVDTLMAEGEEGATGHHRGTKGEHKHGPENHHLNAFHGGPSSPPGMNSHC